ncbi:PTS sugar transporter subunit IIA [uncultured Sutterella sp.]|uniref:PTS sugar transporter subunit IIA n=1 Tax=uncultured Sutterella sp. TaxID=286133 RepID=UPI0025F1EA47|nr:PTS sugar transporter subunit IIA [uncultured Sutterella sp.]
MNPFTPYLRLNAVRLDLDVKSLKRLFEEAAGALEVTYGVPHDEAFAALSERERIGSTALGHGCAVPHGRLESLDSPVVAFLRTREPVKTPSPDGTGAKLFVVILAPAENPEAHLGLLRATAALLSDADARARLIAAPTPTAFCEALSAWVPPVEEAGGAAT